MLTNTEEKIIKAYCAYYGEDYLHISFNAKCALKTMDAVYEHFDVEFGDGVVDLMDHDTILFRMPVNHNVLYL